MGQVFSDIIIFFEFFTFFYVVFRKEYRKPAIKKSIGILICILFFIITKIIGFDIENWAIGPMPMFLIWIYMVLWLLFDSSFTEIVVWGIGEWLILSMLECTMNILLQQLKLEEHILDNIIMLMISCGFWIFYILVRKKYSMQIFHLPIKMWCLIDIIMFILTLMMYLFTYVLIYEFPNNKITLLGQILSAFGGTSILMLLFVMLYYYNSTYDLQRQKDIAEMQNMQQKEYFLQLLEREAETRSFRHDIINDLLAIRNYSANKNYAQMEKYLESTLGTIQRISKNSYDVGNDIVNTVINYYFMPLKETHNVEVDGYMSDKLSIEERELCIVFANIVKNASEAVKKMDNGKVWFKIKEGEKYLSIQVKNTFNGEVYFDRKGIPMTTKKDKRNHGIGIRSVLDIVKRNDGTCSLDAQDGVYKVEICLKK